jgi:hypothetical protein
MLSSRAGQWRFAFRLLQIGHTKVFFSLLFGRKDYATLSQRVYEVSRSGCWGQKERHKVKLQKSHNAGERAMRYLFRYFTASLWLRTGGVAFCFSRSASNI